MPNGVYTGFKADINICKQNGLIALLGYPAKKPKVNSHIYQMYDLIYINLKGEMVLMNQKDVLDALTFHKDSDRIVPDDIERGEEKAIQKLSLALIAWLKNQASQEEIQEDGTTKKVMGNEAKDILEKLKHGSKDAIERIKQNIQVGDKYQSENFDLITWFLVNV
jgi:hypothetical protein